MSEPRAYSAEMRSEAEIVVRQAWEAVRGCSHVHGGACTACLVSALRAAGERTKATLDAVRAERDVGLQISGSFFEALKPLTLPAINVQNPGVHVTALIEDNTRLRAIVAACHDAYGESPGSDDATLAEGIARLREDVAALRAERDALAARVAALEEARSLALTEACLIAARVAELSGRMTGASFRAGAETACEEIIMRLQEIGALVPTDKVDALLHPARPAEPAPGEEG